MSSSLKMPSSTNLMLPVSVAHVVWTYNADLFLARCMRSLNFARKKASHLSLSQPPV
eukprot:CAMPEP_0185497476 /NCGR_PEP_ID=MMETSP1366-20130426/18992_1 /TAXON_ID=38817 /ORGANISM="Gephyrocapsa oceanica, Strain RCC1303" /LENGTH=56 /DNA_ID=CAMNT_0028106585 /DNA_START=167 /DNA_END=337 /DNA_ORIENTATION=+